MVPALAGWGCTSVVETSSGSTEARNDDGAAARSQVLSRYGADSRPTIVRTPRIVGMTLKEASTMLQAEGLGLRTTAGQEDATGGSNFTSNDAPTAGVQRITAQSPPAGQPLPPDGLVEGFVLTPAEPGPGPRSPLGPTPEPTPAPSQTAQAAPIPRLVLPLRTRQTPPRDPTPSPSQATEAPPIPRLVLPGRTSQTSPRAATTETAAPAARENDAAVSSNTVIPGYVLPPHTPGLLRTNPRNLPAVPFGTELTGSASWYGPGFDGSQTACGGIYDQNGATIASRELRCGTVVRITGPAGSTVQATVTDWGPAEWTGRRFDLSAAVFNAIAPLGAGVIPVRVITANVPD
ncbi:hypothetical protein BH24ACT15_BH24ACT15_02840 [soil metagenome]